MNVYAIRDRLIDYFMTPFCGEADKAVLSAVSQLVNTLETTDAIAKAPHQFEVWKLAEIDEQGYTTPKREYLADCSSLLRRSIREKPDTTNEPGATTRTAPTGNSVAPDATGHSSTL